MSSMLADPSWMSKKPTKRLWGMAEALTIASDLGFSIPPIHHQDRIIARLQQPYSLDCIPVEVEYQEMLRPIPAALASCTRFFEAMSATRDSFSALQQLRVGPHSSSLMTPSDSPAGASMYLTPPQWRDGTTGSDDSVVGSWKRQETELQ